MKPAFACLLAYLTTYYTARAIGILPTFLIVVAGFIAHLVLTRPTKK